MIKEETIMQEKTILRRYCDDCGNFLDWIMQCSVAKCEICGKDLCEKCIEHEEERGDYREVYCKPCWNIGEPYRIKINSLEKEIENLQNEWYENGRTISKENV